MKSLKKLLGSESKKAQPSSGVKSEQALTGALWARFRQLEARVSNTESRVSTLRRDCDRIEKKQSREALSAEEEKGNGHDQVHVLKLPDPFARV